VINTVHARHQVQESTECGVSHSNGFTSLWQLPQLPLTEAFGNFDKNFPAYDQELLISQQTGHVQLKYQLNTKTLYTPSEYQFRTVASDKTTSELDFLWNFISKYLSVSEQSRLLEFGANNLTFARLLQSRTQGEIMVCDPLLSGMIPETEISNIKIVGLTIEDATDQVADFSPTIVLARHTLEHIQDPLAVLMNLFLGTNSDTVFIFEVPFLNNLASSLRFDAVFHQHVHYFDLASVRQLAWSAGGRVLDSAVNHSGSNGGSLLFAIAKGRVQELQETVNVSRKELWLRNQISAFNTQMQTIGIILDELDSPARGFGAGLMLSTLDYHLGGRVSSLLEIMDDDHSKHGLQYKNVDVRVVSTRHSPVEKDGVFLVTSLESSRAIFNRLANLGVRKIIAPIVQ